MMGLVNTIQWETCDRWKCGRNRGGSDSWFLRTVVKSGEESTAEVKLNLTADLSRSVWVGSREGEQHFAGAKARRLVYVKSWKEDKWLGVKWSGVRCCVKTEGAGRFAYSLLCGLHLIFLSHRYFNEELISQSIFGPSISRTLPGCCLPSISRTLTGCWVFCLFVFTEVNSVAERK